MTDARYARTWAEIDLDALAHNYNALRGTLPPGCKFLGLCKANAYGHGAIAVARKLQRLGSEMLAVACVDEAIQLRDNGITIPILCFGNTPKEVAPLLCKYHITQMVEDLDSALMLSATAQSEHTVLNIHIKVDTGMSRLGFLWQESGDNTPMLKEIARISTLPGLHLEGVFTHFANADGDEEYTMQQFTRFLDVKRGLAELSVSVEIYHCAASAAVLNYPCTHLDMVRPGLALFGQYPSRDMQGIDGVGLMPVMSVKSRISSVRNLPKGTPVSYGCTAVLERDSCLAVIPIGYGDGYPRKLSGQMEMVIHGQPCQIVGRVCMDMCMVDVTDLPEVAAGDIATVYGNYLMDMAAERAGTITYELMCDVNPRVPRIYLDSAEK